MRRIALSEALTLQVVVAGMHLSAQFGRTVTHIENDGFRIAAKVDMLLSDDTGAAMAKGIGVGIYGFAQSLELLSPDVVLVLGDRVEPFAAAVASTFLQIPVAHIHGGDVAGGGFDEYMRSAITRFAHVHFTATPRSRERVLNLGERPEAVFVVGAPGLDEVLAVPQRDRATLERELGIAKDEVFLLVVQHPVSTEPQRAPTQMRETMEALRTVGLPTILVYPNADAGGRAMIDVIKEYASLPFLRTFESLPREQYVSLLAAATAVVGNSSSAIIEAPAFKVPGVNIGSRQNGRERSTNVLDVPYERAAIVAAIRTAVGDPEFRARVARCVNPYGDGRASERIAEILAALRLDEDVRRKRVVH
jgi:UDP-N-acetylglucosamine 2-epimerase (non-hydrolysing)/GDP/UDP-N,N'-diacetylbacillosamine 2-epimerase (hydrolysing)